MTKHRFGASLGAALGLLVLLALPRLSRATEITIGTGTITWVLPLATNYHDARTQSIYWASEIGMAGQISSLALDITTVPGQVMNNFTIRLKHTPLSSYATASWEAGWTVVYQNNEPQGATGWRTFTFSTPFNYNGTDNLMVDLSFNNSSSSTTGSCRYTDQGVNRTIYYRTDSSYGDPLAWSGTSNPTPSLYNYRPNIRIEIASPDTDGDGLPDYWENQYSCMEPNTVDNLADYDSDGLNNQGEYSHNTNPCVADTDGDGLSDGDEVNIHLTNPLDPDTDNDEVYDGNEIIGGSNPLDPRITPSLIKLGSDLRVTRDSFSSHQYPSLSWTGSEFGVSWEDSRDLNPEIYFARVSSSGDKIGSDLRVTSHSSDSSSPSLSWTGSEFGVSWHDSQDGNFEIYFARFSSSGEKVGSDLQVTSALYDRWVPSLSWTGSEFGVSWEDDRDGTPGQPEIYFARVSSSGDKIGSDLRVTSNASDSSSPSLSWTGSEFGVSWQDNMWGNYEIYFARVSAGGVKIGSNLRVTSNASYSYDPSLSWTGSEFGVSWWDYRDGNYEIYFARVSSSGVKVGTDLRVTSAVNESHDPFLYWTGSEFGMSWEDLRDGNSEIYFVRVSADGLKVGSDLRVTSNASYSVNPSLSWTGSEFGVSWQDYRDGSYEIYFSRIFYDHDGDGLYPAEEALAGTNANDWDTDDDLLPDGWEVNNGLDPLAPNGGLDADNDGLTNLEEYQNGTSPLDWDTDGDALPDGYEVAHAGSSPPLDALNLVDGAADFDGDGNSNANEYWNGTDPWTKNPVGGAGCFFWADAGAGDGIVSPTDAIELKKAISGGVGNYTGVVPNNGETHELDMDGYISPSDLIILQKMIQGAAIGPLGSRPTALVTTDAPGATVNVGFTTHVTVSVLNEAAKGTPGIGVIFEIVPASSTATATLLGGDGRGAGAPTGTRYDISGPIASSGLSRIVLRMDSAGTITIQAGIPACGAPGIGRSCGAITLSPAAIIHAQ